MKFNDNDNSASRFSTRRPTQNIHFCGSHHLCIVKEMFGIKLHWRLLRKVIDKMYYWVGNGTSQFASHYINQWLRYVHWFICTSKDLSDSCNDSLRVCSFAMCFIKHSQHFSMWFILIIIFWLDCFALKFKKSLKNPKICVGVAIDSS